MQWRTTQRRLNETFCVRGDGKEGCPHLYDFVSPKRRNCDEVSRSSHVRCAGDEMRVSSGVSIAVIRFVEHAVRKLPAHL